MAKPPPDPLAETAKRLYASLYASLLRAEKRQAFKAGVPSSAVSLPFTIDEFRNWLRIVSTPPGTGKLWICPYTGEHIALSHDPKRPGDAMTIDHCRPHALGGATVLSNLRVTNQRTNRQKADMTPDGFERLLTFLEREATCRSMGGFDRQSVLKRLGQG